MREQRLLNAQLVPTYRDQPANEHRRVLGVWRFFFLSVLLIVVTLFL